MSAASDLIERMERETGQRIDSDDPNNMAMAGLFGAIARMMGKSSHQERDDVAAGVLIQNRMSPEYQRKQEDCELLASLLQMGLSPDEVRDLISGGQKKQ
jgi:hypothetical protein